MIEIENLTKKFGSITAVEKLSLKIRRGELFGLAGPNGAGKTTVVRILCGALKPSEGTIRVNGLNMLSDGERIKSMIGYLPEEPNLYERMSARKFLEFFAELYGVNGRRRIAELLDAVGIDRADSKIATFSKGMRQRLAIARALLHDPEILILDEPTMGLDPLSARMLRQFVAEQKGKKTILMCTHYMNEADELCDRIGILNSGRLVALGAPGELKRSAYAANLEDAFIHFVKGMKLE